MAKKTNKQTNKEADGPRGKNPRGRKCLYDEIVKPRLAWINEQVRNGIREAAIADALGITEVTLNNYKKKYPELVEALNYRKGADVLQKLINSGIDAACGQWIEEETITVLLDKDGKPSKRQKVTTKRYIPPNPALNQYYTKHFGQEEGFTGDPLALEFKKAKLEFDKAVQSEKDWKDYE